MVERPGTKAALPRENQNFSTGLLVHLYLLLAHACMHACMPCFRLSPPPPCCTHPLPLGCRPASPFHPVPPSCTPPPRLTWLPPCLPPGCRPAPPGGLPPSHFPPSCCTRLPSSTLSPPSLIPGCRPAPPGGLLLRRCEGRVQRPGAAQGDAGGDAAAGGPGGRGGEDEPGGGRAHLGLARAGQGAVPHAGNGAGEGLRPGPLPFPLFHVPSGMY